MTSQNVVQQTALANSKKSHPIKLISHLERKEDQISVSLKIILKVSHQIQYLATSSMPVYQRMAVKFSLQATVMSNELEESILIKNIELAKFIFVHSAVQQGSSRITISNHHFLMISQMLLLSTQEPTILYTMSAMKISLGISSRLVQIVKVTVLTMSLFCQFQLKKIQR